MKLALGNRVQNAQLSHTNRSARYLMFSYSVMPMLMLVLISHALILCICNTVQRPERTRDGHGLNVSSMQGKNRTAQNESRDT